MNNYLTESRGTTACPGTGLAISCNVNITTRPAHGIEIVVRTSQANRRELLQTLEEFRGRLGGDPCRCDIFESMTDANLYLWAEWWPDPDQVTQAKASARFRTLLGAIRVLGSLEQIRDLEGSEKTGRKTPGTYQPENID